MRRVSSPSVGPLVKEWRARRGRSQMDLAHSAGVSTRHLSFVETGRSRPSPELVLALAEDLDVPLRERNTMLLAAGFAPRYARTPLDDPTMAHITASLQRLLDAHDPYPGVALDRHWDVVLANRAAGALIGLLPPELAGPPTNIFRVSLHPGGLAAHTVNFDEWATYLLGQLRRLVAVTGDPGLGTVEAEVSGYPNVVALLGRAAPTSPDEPALLVPYRLRLNDAELSLFTTLTTFGTPRDVTLDELAIELFFPADESTASVLREMAGW